MKHAILTNLGVLEKIQWMLYIVCMIFFSL